MMTVSELIHRLKMLDGDEVLVISDRADEDHMRFQSIIGVVGGWLFQEEGHDHGHAVFIDLEDLPENIRPPFDLYTKVAVLI